MQSTILLILATFLVGTHATCPEADQVIRKFWKTNPPPIGMPRKLIGHLQYVTAPSYIRNVSLAPCLRVPVKYWGEDGSSENVTTGKNPLFDVFEMEEIEQGIISLSDGFSDEDEHLYVVSFANKVLVLYQCEVTKDPIFSPYSAIAVLNMKNQDLTPYQKDIDVGYATLKNLGIPPLSKLSVSCDDYFPDKKVA